MGHVRVVGIMWADKVARALISAHQEDCREDRVRTDRRFSEVKDEISSFRQDFREFMTAQASQHETNRRAIDGIKKFVFMGMGAFAVVAVVAEIVGGMLLRVLSGAGH